MSNKSAIGFIGLGQMGQPMAARLVAAGHRVQGADLSDTALQGFAAAGGVACASAAEAAEGAALVITMLPDGKAVRAAVLGSAAERMASGSLLVDMSSSAPGDTVALHRELAAMGLHMVDAPVSGGVARAVKGTLSIMAGGAAADIEDARAVLEHLGSVIPTGPIGSGHAMKALNNFVSAAGAAAAMEALLVGREFGLQPETMVDVLNQATGRNNTTELKLKQFVLSGCYDSGFDIGLMAKDIGIARGLAEDLGLPMALLQDMADSWAEASAALGARADHTAYFRYLAERAKRGAQ